MIPVIFIFCLAFLGALSKDLRADQGVNKDEIRALLGEVQMINQDYPEAVQQYQKVLQKDPKNTKVRGQLADVLSWQKKYPEAILEYQKILETEPRNLEVQKKIAEIYVWQRDYEKAEALYQELLAQDPQNPKQTLALAEIFSRLGKIDEAQRLIHAVLEKDPQDLDAKTLLARSYAANKDFKKSITLFHEVLNKKYDRKIQAQLGDVLSWSGNYREALKVYDGLLAEKEDKAFRLQKARILGWAREYSKAQREYQKILTLKYDELVEQEMKAKQFYWDNRVKHALSAYEELIRKDPENVEARFDLSQIYSYQAMWDQAIGQYQNILNAFADHFRARDGLRKAQWISSHPAVISGYEFFKGRSTSRDTDIHKNVFTNRFNMPLNARTVLGGGYDFVRRSFSDRRDLTENQGRISLDYYQEPDWSGGAYFNLITYYKGIAPVYEFGEHFIFRTFDMGQMTLSHERQRLENNSEVIERRFYRDDFKVREDIDLTVRLKLGADYIFSFFSDHNVCHEPGADILYYFSLEPKAFYVKYRYAFREFQHKKNEYFSPQDFSLHTISFRWRHYLNKEGVFFGANDIYYEANYDLSIDSTGIVSHKVGGGLSWDITDRFTIKGEGQYTHATARVYDDAGAKASLKYYFG